MNMKMKRLFCIISAALFLAGCSSGGKNSDAPSDIPSNFYSTLMETENGYYYNDGGDERSFSLRFYDKATNSEVYLCNKPECMHNGNSFCAATSNDLKVSDWVLYDNAIYLLCQQSSSVNETVSVYKAALDGSSLTMLYDVAQIKKSSGQEYQMTAGDMIIHKNRIYLTYKLVPAGEGLGFGEAEFCEINMKNGEIKVLLEANMPTGTLPSCFYGIGDKVYYALYGYTSGIYEYDQNSGETTELGMLFSIMKSDGESLYGIKYYEDVGDTICRYDLNTKEMSSIVHITPPGLNEIFTVCDGLIFIYEQQENFEYVVSVYDMSGNRVCIIDPKDMEEYAASQILCRAYDGNVYMDMYVEKTEGEGFTNLKRVFSYDAMYKCSIEDIRNGNADFMLVYKRNEFYGEEYTE